MPCAPSFLGIVAAKLLHVGSSSVLGPAIAAITLGLVGHAAVGPRLGRNARFASIGNGLAAGAMGACGYFISPLAVFFVTAALAIPTLMALAQIQEAEIDPVRADGGIIRSGAGPHCQPASALLLRNRALITLAVCVFLFHAANAAMLPLVGAEMTVRSAQWATALIAVCIFVPQLIVALIAPSVGQLAVVKGRRPVLLLGFAALPARAAMLAFNSDPAIIVAAQMLDGLCAAVLGVLVPLSLADISRGTGRFNLAQGIVASATGIGAALSTTAGGLPRASVWNARRVPGARSHCSSSFPHRPAGDARNRSRLTQHPGRRNRNGGVSSLQCSDGTARERHCVENLASYSERPVAFFFSYVRRRGKAHAVIAGTVATAVLCSIVTQYAVKLLVDTLSVSPAQPVPRSGRPSPCWWR